MDYLLSLNEEQVKAVTFTYYFLNELPEKLYNLNGNNISDKNIENSVYKGSKISVDIDLF